MDSKIVNKEIKRVIHPLLKNAGFSIFTSRSAWRYTEHRIDIVNFQSYNSYNASVMECTSYSFVVNIGVYPLAVPYDLGEDRMKQRNGFLLPEEYQCPFRIALKRNIKQPESKYDELWYIDPEGRYISEAVDDASKAIVRDGFPWFDRLRDTEEILRIFLNEPRTLGCGSHNSPARSYLIGYLAKSLNQFSLAQDELQRAYDSGCFRWVENNLLKDIRFCGLTRRSS